ncbi:MAG: TlpA family protein disulfide reductase [Candidatus Aegiribacteria sp.]|nr:TlpA family protein disulfide reductase [Candidatus Aegiribacteria sp.]
MLYSRLRSFLWIPVVLVFLIPVLKYAGSKRAEGESVTQGLLLVGRDALDSLLLSSEGKPVIVNFWATWCTPCVGELPHIDEVYRSMEGEIAAIAVDIGDPELETLLGFREVFKLSMPVVWLSENDAFILKQEWNLADVLPITLIYDAFGNEIRRAAGIRDREFFRSAVSGAIIEDTILIENPPDLVLHVNVVGFATDSLTEILLQTAIELAGHEGVDYFDPSVSSDSMEIEALFLPKTGYPYAQPCIGGACGRPARTPDELLQAVENLSN